MKTVSKSSETIQTKLHATFSRRDNPNLKSFTKHGLLNRFLICYLVFANMLRFSKGIWVCW